VLSVLFTESGSSWRDTDQVVEPGPLWHPSLYAGSARYYATGRVGYPAALTRALAQQLGLDGSGRLLDVGCGPGSLTLLLAPWFEQATGVECRPAASEGATCRNQRTGRELSRAGHSEGQGLPVAGQRQPRGGGRPGRRFQRAAADRGLRGHRGAHQRSNCGWHLLSFQLDSAPVWGTPGCVRKLIFGGCSITPAQPESSASRCGRSRQTSGAHQGKTVLI
jgi:hypothetical protein